MAISDESARRRRTSKVRTDPAWVAILRNSPNVTIVMRRNITSTSCAFFTIKTLAASAFSASSRFNFYCYMAQAINSNFFKRHTVRAFLPINKIQIAPPAIRRPTNRPRHTCRPTHLTNCWFAPEQVKVGSDDRSTGTASSRLKTTEVNKSCSNAFSNTSRVSPEESN